jgi:hypothetical protein
MQSSNNLHPVRYAALPHQGNLKWLIIAVYRIVLPETLHCRCNDPARRCRQEARRVMRRLLQGWVERSFITLARVLSVVSFASCMGLPLAGSRTHFKGDSLGEQAA